MDATKALAQRLRRRNSRWRDRKGSVARSTTSNPAVVAGRDPPTSAPAPAPAPAAAPETEKASLTVDPPKAIVETPSPGSDVSPTTQAPPRQVDIDKHDLEKRAGYPTAETTAGYFSHKATDYNPTKEAPAGKIKFAVPTKEEKEEGVIGLNAERESKEFDTALSSAAPSIGVSPRTSEDDDEAEEKEDEELGRSSTLSGSGDGSRQSSIASVAFRMPDGSLPQGRPRRHRNSLPPTSR